MKKKKKGGFVYILIEGFWQEEARGRLTRSGSSYVVGLVSTVDCHQLALSWKQGQKLGMLAVIGLVLSILD